MKVEKKGFFDVTNKVSFLIYKKVERNFWMELTSLTSISRKIITIVKLLYFFFTQN